MPIYDFECPICHKVEERLVRSLGHPRYSHPTCKECNVHLTKLVSAPHFKFESKSGVYSPSGSFKSGEKQHPLVPINIIDEMPDGSTKVTRIGKKQDIENE